MLTRDDNGLSAHAIKKTARVLKTIPVLLGEAISFRNRSILGVCEDFGCAYNEEIRPQADFYKIYSRPFAFLNNGL
jgi:hypothetical protein